MMDPLTVAGLVSNILSFLSFSHEVFSTSREILTSASGAPSEVVQLRSLIHNIKETNEAVAGSASPQSHEPINAIVVECERLADNLLKDIKKFAPSAKHSSLQAVKTAAVFTWRKKHIEERKRQLLLLESRLNQWWTRKENERQSSSMQEAIEDLKRSMARLEASSSPVDQLNRLQLSLDQCMKSQASYSTTLEQLLTNKFKSSNSRAQDAQKTAVQQNSDAHAKGLQHTIANLNSLQDELRRVKRQEVVLSSLQFSSIRRRHSDIEEAHVRTLQWVFQDNSSKFVPWLKEGQGVYWMNGLAGSGKSTMMKYVSKARQTSLALQTWALNERVVIASHYFWRAGTIMQRSQQGLFQSLLYHVLREVPHITDEICGFNYRVGDVWGVAELKACFARLAAKNLGIKYCLFVDGLDEFEGARDGEDIIEVVNLLASSSHIKVCTSSRPWPAFTSEWGSSEQQLVVQDFTAADMKLYTREKLAENPRFKSLSLTDERYHELVRVLSKRSNGVWLWVYLAVRDLLRDIRDHEPYDQLLARLNSYPQELNEYFEDIIQRIDPIHREQSAIIFLLAYEAARPMSIQMLPALEQWRDITVVTRMEIVPATREEMKDIYREWLPRLQNRCRDLIKITSDDKESPINEYQIDFLHRSVSDWLAEHHLEKLRTSTPREFDPSAFLMRLVLMCLKLTDADDFRGHLNSLIAYVDEMLMYAWKIEQRPDDEYSSTRQTELLNELDHIMQIHSRKQQRHWTNARDPLPDDESESWHEGGQATFLALAIQAHLRRYVARKLSEDPSPVAKKPGRPLLDYALRPERVTPVVLQYNYHHDMPWIDPKLVQLLLQRGADPNAKVRILGSQSPWLLFLLSCRKNWYRWPPETKRSVHESLKFLIQFGANPNVELPPESRADEYDGDISKPSRHEENTSPGQSAALNSNASMATTVRFQQQVIVERSAKEWVNLRSLLEVLFPDQIERDELLLVLSEATKSKTLVFFNRILHWRPSS